MHKHKGHKESAEPHRGVSESLWALCFSVAFVLIVAFASCGDEARRCQGEHLDDLQALSAALSDGDSLQARAIISRVENEATDSLDYYYGVEMETRFWFALSRRDSFSAASGRIHAFLAKNTHSIDRQTALLNALWHLQQGAYQARMMAQPDSAVAHDEAALSILHSLSPSPRQTEELHRALTNTADGYMQLGQYDRTVERYREAALIDDSLNASTLDRLPVLMGLAMAYTNMGNFYQSNRWWEFCGQYVESMHPRERFLYFNNRGNDLYLQQRYDESIALFRRLDSMTTGRPDLMWERIFGRTNMADLCLKLGRTDEAEALLNEAEAFFAANPFYPAQYYLATLRIEQAVMQGRRDLPEALAAQTPVKPGLPSQQRVLRLKAMERHFTSIGDEMRLANTLSHRLRLEDSLRNDQMRMRFQEDITAYNHERIMAEKDAQLGRQRIMTGVGWAIAIVTIVIMAMLVLLLQQRRKMQQLRQKVQHERMQSLVNRVLRLRLENLRNRLTPHFLGNALTAPLLAQAEGRPADLTPIVTLLHQGLQLSAVPTITLQQELSFIRSFVDVTVQSFPFTYHEELSPEIDIAHQPVPSMLLQTLMENALKHGLKQLPPQSERPRIIKLSVNRDHEATIITVTDSGHGLGHSSAQGTGTGLTVVKRVLGLFNQEAPRPITFTIDNLPDAPDGFPAGCQVTLTIPDNFPFPNFQTSSE